MSYMCREHVASPLPVLDPIPLRGALQSTHRDAGRFLMGEADYAVDAFDAVLEAIHDASRSTFVEHP